MKLLRTFALIMILSFLVSPVLSAQSKATEEEAKNITLVKQLFEELWNQGKEELAEKLIAPDCIYITNGVNTEKTGPEMMLAALKENQMNMPGFRYTIQDMFAKDNKVVTRYVFQGVHKKLGKAVTMYAVQISEMKSGKIAAIWLFTNRLRFLQDLGFKLAPPPGVKMAGQKPDQKAAK